MIPPRVYVGDRASFVVPLPDFPVSGNAAVQLARSPASPDIDIHRARLERRPGGNHLIIEFTAFAPGMLELPTFEIAGKTVSGLTVNISSIIADGASSPALAGPAGPLAIPGTSLLVYGTLCAMILILLLAAWGLFWGRKNLKRWIDVWRRWRLLASMARVEKKLRKSLAKGAALRTILDTLSAEFRKFLSHFFAESCRSMTAAEFSRAVFLEEYAIDDKLFLGRFFNRCDFLRFSGKDIDPHETQAVLDDARDFLAALGKAKRSAA